MSASTTITMVAPAGTPPSTIQTRNGNSYSPNTYGIVSVYAIDVPDLIAAGFTIVGAAPPATSQVVYMDDFLGDTINLDNYAVDKGSDGAAVNFAIAAAAGGTIAATTGAGAGASMAANGVQIVGGLNWYAQNGGLFIETRLKLDAITTVALYAGFGDQIAALEMPFTISGSTVTSNITDGCGFLFDTAATAATMKALGVANDVDATLQDLAFAPVAASFVTLRMELSTAGVATFYRNGQLVGSAMSGAVRPSIALTPYIGGFSRAAASRVFTVDYIAMGQTR